MYHQFIFESYSLYPESKSVILNYSFDGKIHFTERFTFDFEWVSQIDLQTLDRAVQGLWLMAGISYFKAYLPPQIIIQGMSLTQQQKTFFDTIYTLGLGEFFYRNGIDPVGKVSFPHEKEKIAIPQDMGNYTGNLVLVGGGKDSLTSLEILKTQGEISETLTVGKYPFFQSMIERIGFPHNTVIRTIDPQLFTINAQGAYNGHIPISSILAFVSVITAILRGKEYIILSNEQSANEPNLILDSGIAINHQYSKSLDFEKDFQNYVRAHITPKIHYFSLLRPLSEIQIAEIFCRKVFPTYKKDFSSCNRNFSLQNTSTSFQWCGQCPKCAFVFLLFSPFLSRKDLEDLLGCDIWNVPSLQETFQELLGIRGYKPFECVGEIEEVRHAFHLALKKPDYADFIREKVPQSTYQEAFHPHSMPLKFEKHIQKFIKAFR